MLGNKRLQQNRHPGSSLLGFLTQPEVCLPLGQSGAVRGLLPLLNGHLFSSTAEDK